MDNVNRFDETELPSQEEFYNKLSDSSCSNLDYAHAVNVGETFDCENMGDYHDVYLQLDVLLLEDFL